MDAQSYHPFRTSLVTREELRELSALKPWIPVRDTLLHWSIILASWGMVAVWPNPGTFLLAFVLVGVNSYGLYIIAHDGLHRRLFRSIRNNDLWNDLCVVAPFGAITRINHHNHMTHHQITCAPNDPDRHKYTHDGKEPVLPFMMFLTGLANLVPALRNVFLPGREQPVEAPQQRRGERYTLRDLLILGGWHTVLIAGMSYFIGWWAYPLLWLAPAYAFAYRGDLTRVFCEHSMPVSDQAADESMRLITYRSNWLEKLFFAPHNMNYHMAHHLWISIPYYNLPKADALIQRSEFVKRGDPRLVWRDSYVGYLWTYFRWRLGASSKVASLPV